MSVKCEVKENQTGSDHGEGWVNEMVMVSTLVWRRDEDN